MITYRDKGGPSGQISNRVCWVARIMYNQMRIKLSLSKVGKGLIEDVFSVGFLV
jgi:hypothetical protein